MYVCDGHLSPTFHLSRVFCPSRSGSSPYAQVQKLGVLLYLLRILGASSLQGVDGSPLYRGNSVRQAGHKVSQELGLFQQMAYAYFFVKADINLMISST